MVKKAINIKLDESIIEEAKKLAGEENRSLKNFCENIIIEYIKDNKKKNKEISQNEEFDEQIIREKTNNNSINLSDLKHNL